MAKKAAPQTDTARKIWLAGIGAYGRAFSEAQEKVAKLTGESQRVFDDLVARGEAIEKKVEAEGRKVAAQVGPGGALIDDRIKRLRERIGLGAGDEDAVADRLAAIESRLAAIEAQLGQGPRAKRKSVKKKA